MPKTISDIEKMIKKFSEAKIELEVDSIPEIDTRGYNVELPTPVEIPSIYPNTYSGVHPSRKPQKSKSKQVKPRLKSKSDIGKNMELLKNLRFNQDSESLGYTLALNVILKLQKSTITDLSHEDFKKLLKVEINGIERSFLDKINKIKNEFS